MMVDGKNAIFNDKLIFMTDKTHELLERTFNFGIKVLIDLSKLPYNDITAVPRRQFAKAATSIGANYEEAQAAESKRDFIHKIGVVCKETRESNYWARVLEAICNDASQKNQFKEYKEESDELKRIFTSIKLSAEKNLKK